MATPNPDPTDDIGAIAARYAMVAKDIVNQSAQVAVTAFEQINELTPNPYPESPPYRPADAVRTFSKLANIALTGGMSLARVALQVRPDRRVMLVLDNVADSMSSVLGDVMEVGRDATVLANDFDFTREQVDRNREKWLDSAIQLTKIAALRGAEIVETVVAGPGQFGETTLTREFRIDARPYARTLAMAELRRAIDGTDIAALAVFEPVTLSAAATDFTVTMNTVGLHSAVYEGTIAAVAADPTDPAANAAVPQAFPVSIAIPELPGANAATEYLTE